MARVIPESVAGQSSLRPRVGREPRMTGSRRPTAGLVRRIGHATGSVVRAVALVFVLAGPVQLLLPFLRPLPATALLLGSVAAIAFHPRLLTGRRRRRWQATLGIRPLDRSTLPWLAGAVILFQCYQWISPALVAQLTTARQPLPDPYVHAAEPFGWLVGPLMAALLMPLAEELAMRGYLQHKLSWTLGRRAALAVTCVVFGLLHGSLRLAPFFILAGVVFGCALLAFRSIWAPVLVHAVANGFGQIPATAGVPHPIEPLAHGYWPWVITPTCVCGALLLMYGGCRARLRARRRRREAGSPRAPSPKRSWQPA